MQKIFLFLSTLILVTGVSAQEAPVYEADSYPPSFDGQPDTQAQANVEQSSPVSSLGMEGRVSRLERQMASNLQSTSANKVNSLMSEVQTLRGEVEDLTHQLQQLKTQQKAMYEDLSVKHPTEPSPKLSTALNTNVHPVIKPSESTSENNDNQPNVAEEQQIYQTAYNFIKEKKYNEAVDALQNMLKKYPAGQFAANAHYWLGELYGLMNKNDLSATEFNTIIKNYPDSPKISDAQLKLGLIYASASKWSEAKTAFKKVINKYPGTPSARFAAEQLKQLKRTSRGV